MNVVEKSQNYNLVCRKLLAISRDLSTSLRSLEMTQTYIKFLFEISTSLPTNFYISLIIVATRGESVETNL